MIKRFVFSILFLLVSWGCEKKPAIDSVEPTEVSDVATQENKFEISNLDPIKTDENKIELPKSIQTTEKIKNTYLANINKTSFLENSVILKDFLNSEMEFQNQWRYWLYNHEDKEGIMVLSEKNIDSHHEYMSDQIEKIIEVNKKMDALLEKIYKVCNAQSGDISCM